MAEKKNDEPGVRNRSSSRCSVERMNNEATPKLIHSALDVKTWAQNDPDVEAARPRRCRGCGLAARRADGRLRIHGHGRRLRGVWGPWRPCEEAMVRELVVRRYRCVECSAVMTVVPAGVARGMRYLLGAVAMALLLWALRGRPAAEVRKIVSPWKLVGVSEPARWRSLRRWADRARDVFGLGLSATTVRREDAARVARLLIARGPPGVAELERVFVGAHAP